ncbi:UBN2 domain-containing protein, partial [Cephalotus follicularis]
KNFKALSFLHSAVALSIFPRIVAASIAKQAWDILQEEFQGSVRVRTIRLLNFRRDFENLKMKDNESVKEYVSRLMGVVNQMKIYGEMLTDQKIVEKVLISLPDKFDSKVSAIEESKDLTELSLTELIGSLQIHEQRMNIRTEVATEGAYQVKHKNKQTYSKQLKQNKQGNQSNQQAHIVEDQKQDNHLFMAAQTGGNASKGSWLIDSACTNHMSYDPTLFHYLDTSVNASIKIGDGTEVQATDKGVVAVQTNQGTEFIKNVYLVPELDQNLLSVAQMMSNDYSLS